jgi:cardiolipin synthase
MVGRAGTQKTAGRDEPSTRTPADPLEALLEGFVGVPLSTANDVELLEDEHVLQRLAEDLGNARQSITFQVYYIEKGHVLDEFVRLFRSRAQAGVRVRLLVDALGTKALSTRKIRRFLGDSVQVARVRGERLRHPIRFFQRAHSRTCVIDGCIAYTGGFGLSDKWAPTPGSKLPWRDLAVRVVGRAALTLQGQFTKLWAEARKGELIPEAELFPPEALEASGRTTAGVLVSSGSQAITGASRFLEVLCARAEKRLWIYSGYFAPGPEQRAILEAAARRGVDVRVLTANERTDLGIVRLAGRGQYPALLEAGVRIWEYQPSMLHAKAFLLDERLAGVGSLNMVPASTELSEETVLIALDPRVARGLAHLFLHDLAHSREVRAETWGRQPLLRRLSERAGALLLRVP